MSNYVLKIVTINFSDSKSNFFLDIDLNPVSNFFQYIGCNFNVLDFNYFDMKLKFQLWNLSPKFDSILDFYLIGNMGAIIIFDHDKLNSFIKTMDFIEKLSNSKRNNDIPITLIGLNSVISNDKTNNSGEQIQEIINQFLSPNENGLKLRYIPLNGSINLLMEKLLFYFVDNYIIKNHLDIKEEIINRKPLNEKILENQIKLYNLDSKNVKHVSCFMDKKKVEFDKIAKWVICESCSIHICPSCFEYLVREDFYYCPGSIFSKRHEFNPLMITN